MSTSTSTSTIPKQLLLRIDRAFDVVSRLGRSSQAQGVTQPAFASFSVQSDQPGGFIVDDSPGGFLLDHTPGGFVVENNVDDEEGATASPEHLPLSLVPTALQQLDLPPDDPEILAVFRNAASGWRNDEAMDQDKGPVVSRDDWHSVCAVLLEHDDAGADEISQLSQDDAEPDFANDGSSDEYMDEDDPSDAVEQHASDDDYAPGSGTPNGRLAPGKTRRKARVASPLAFESEDGDTYAKPLTARQKSECRKAFALFFPDVPDSALDMHKIMIKDVAQVAKVLKEKLTAEDIIEMLEAFSTAKDKSMSLVDFERMMVATKMA